MASAMYHSYYKVSQNLIISLEVSVIANILLASISYGAMLKIGTSLPQAPVLYINRRASSLYAIIAASSRNWRDFYLDCGSYDALCHKWVLYRSIAISSRRLEFAQLPY